MSKGTVDVRNANNPDANLRPQLIWTDPPYGTGKVQSQSKNKYFDNADTEYVVTALQGWANQLDSKGTMCVCCDYRLTADLIHGMRDVGMTYMGEVVWTFGLGRPRTSWWPVRHNSIHTFVGADGGLFDPRAVPRERRLAPKPGYPDDRPSGSVWDFTFNNSNPQRVGYPNQKPIELIKPFILAHTEPGDLVVDPFCGSSSTGEAALSLGRFYAGFDISEDAVYLSTERLRTLDGEV